MRQAAIHELFHDALCLFNLDDHLDFDWDIHWQRTHADRRACRPAGTAEDYDHELGKPAEHTRMVPEDGLGIDHAPDINHPQDPLEVAETGLRCG